MFTIWRRWNEGGKEVERRVGEERWRTGVVSKGR